MIYVILAFVFVAVVSSLITRMYLQTYTIGNLLVIQEENEAPMLMLEVYQGEMNKIQPGHVVKLLVTQNKQPS